VQGLSFYGPPPRNIVMISVDTLRRDHLGRYRAGPTLTPFLDARMAEGFALDDVMGCSNWTVAGTACALAGASNLDRAEARGMVPILTGSPLENIPKAGDPLGPTPLLPSFLREYGFTSLLVTANGYFSNAYGNAQGYDDLVYPGPVPIRDLWDLAAAHLAAAPLPAPFLLHLHAFEPHAPYLPGDAYLGGLDALPPIPFDLSTQRGQEQAIAALYADPPTLDAATVAAVEDQLRVYYAGEVQRLDDGVAEVWGEMDAAGLLDDALVVFWTDHGEAFFEQNVHEHGKLLYRNENDVVAWFWARNIVSGAYAGPLEQSDLAPTLFAGLGLALPSEMSGVPAGTERPDRVRHALTDAYKGPVQAVRKNQYKLQFRWAGEDGVASLGWYDLDADPGEQVNLYDPTAVPSQALLDLWDPLRTDVLAAAPWIAADPRDWAVSWPPGLPGP
jgi:arylsulfatase A-like enzyme